VDDIFTTASLRVIRFSKKKKNYSSTRPDDDVTGAGVGDCFSPSNLMETPYYYYMISTTLYGDDFDGACGEHINVCAETALAKYYATIYVYDK